MPSAPQKHPGCCPPAAARVNGTRTATTAAALPANPTSDSNATAATIREIPGGRALLGTNAPLIDEDEESPLRKEKLKPFWIDDAAVTNAQFEEFVRHTGHVTQAERLGDSFVFDGGAIDPADESRVAAAPWWRMVKHADWRRPAGAGSEEECRPDHPVVHVSWHDATAYAAWAGGRLPTEVEWEHAARGGQGDVPFPWGDAAPNDDDFFPCNIWQGRFPDMNTQRDGHAGTAPARSYQPNDYGLYNLIGNVWEWTAQPFRVRSLKKTLKKLHAGKQGFKVLKGGSYLCHRSYCHRYRIAARTASSPDSSTSHQGFRVVYDNPPA